MRDDIAHAASAVPKRTAVLLAAPALLLVAALYLFPLARLAVISFGEGGASFAAYYELFAAWSYGDLLLRSLRLSACTVIGCLLFGYPLGYVLAFASRSGRAALVIIVLLPLWTSVLVRNFAWVFLLRDGGALSSIAGMFTAAGAPVVLLYRELGVLIAMVGTLLPFMALPVYVSIASQDRRLHEAAASLGADPARVFFDVTFPQSRPGVYAGSMLVFVTAMGFFVTPAVLGGGRVLVSATFINQQIEDFLNWPLAAAAAMVLLLIVLAALALYRRLEAPRIPRSSHETA
jgi:ABC-type spermidine/putrescine transport system permease subunit I